ncbi:MAG: TolC family protein [Bacteroidota bacterium]
MRLRLPYITVAMLLLMSIAPKSRAQVLFPSQGLDEVENVPLELPPVQVLIDSALKYSRKVKISSNGLQAISRGLAIEKNSILKSVSFIAAYDYGTAGSFTVTETATNTDADNTLRTIQSARYTIGASLKVSLGDLLDRNHKLAIANLSIEEAKMALVETEIEVRNLVIGQYHELLLSKKLLDLYASSKESATVNLQVAEQQFLTNEINVTDLTRVTDAFAKTVADFETAKIRYQVAYLTLEGTVGVPLISFRKGVGK